MSIGIRWFFAITALTYLFQVNLGIQINTQSKNEILPYNKKVTKRKLTVTELAKFSIGKDSNIQDRRLQISLSDQEVGNSSLPISTLLNSTLPENKLNLQHSSLDKILKQEDLSKEKNKNSELLNNSRSISTNITETTNFINTTTVLPSTISNNETVKSIVPKTLNRNTTNDNKKPFDNVFQMIQNPDWVATDGDYHLIEFFRPNSTEPLVRLVSLSVAMYNTKQDTDEAKKLIELLLGPIKEFDSKNNIMTNEETFDKNMSSSEVESEITDFLGILSNMILF
ncbi:uncharacterized protein CMU_011110 [Cryptosporidium muris RN66]|uniref:Uncharacterized protein n=1 Tax=Cryptosporidium muris (strain RN66) TaxID=441375 RepID=B6AIX2_CRYMR|nr:uncharacterized protein CMU_011110 [Cryptosporidium muris RN66]EEA08163.1 hypothetical protein, conserved [Cryptosporidium muris RN66]|eukprot:XP_002142512.1 hypothetical protein [Cryptosporidium muris RN66]